MCTVAGQFGGFEHEAKVCIDKLFPREDTTSPRIAALAAAGYAEVVCWSWRARGK